MLVGNLNDPQEHTNELSHPTWQRALEWLKIAQEKADGEYEINGRDLYASISTINTLPVEQGLFEAHKQYIDIHCCISGGEIIGWVPIQELSEVKESNSEKDYTLFKQPAQYNRIQLTPGMFAIFLPADAHMPKITDNKNKSTRKVVVKIRLSMLLA